MVVTFKINGSTYIIDDASPAPTGWSGSETVLLQQDYGDRIGKHLRCSTMRQALSYLSRSTKKDLYEIEKIYYQARKNAETQKQ